MRRSLLVSLLLLLALPATAAARTSLVSVAVSGPRDVALLENAGFDVTHDVTDRRARVLVAAGAEQRRLARLFPYRVVVRDVERATARYRATERRRARAAQGGGGLPSGRQSYRYPGDYAKDLADLAAGNPGLVRAFELPKRSIEGRPIAGVEIATDVNRADDGRPSYVVSALHHAREWPSGEVAMEFALDLVQRFKAGDARVQALLGRVRVHVIPVSNPDGYAVSRGESAAASAGTVPLHRKNCRVNPGEDPESTCASRADRASAGSGTGVDPNRNYGAQWGGPGASAGATSASFRGAGPFSEPETQAMHEFSQRLQITNYHSLHNIAGQVLRQPGNFDYGEVSPDEPIQKPLGDAEAATVGYDSLLGWELYPVHGATEDWNYIAQGAQGYTIEIGPKDPVGVPLFQGPYQSHVIDQYVGGESGGGTGQGLREALLLAAEQAARDADHAIVAGTAPAGRVLRLRKAFQTSTSRVCAPDASSDAAGRTCDPSSDPILFDDFIDTTTVVPAGGSFTWHVNPSTRPYVRRDGGREAWTLTCETPEGQVLETVALTVDRGQRATLGLGCGTGPSTAPVISQTPGARAPARTLRPPRGTRLVVGRVLRVDRRVLRRRRTLPVRIRLAGTTLRAVRVLLVDRGGSRRVRASRSRLAAADGAADGHAAPAARRAAPRLVPHQRARDGVQRRHRGGRRARDGAALTQTRVAPSQIA